MGGKAPNEPHFHTGEWNRVFRRFSDSLEVERDCETLDDVLTNSHIAKAENRLAVLATYEDDWDGEGAAAPVASTVKEAANFLKRLEPWHPRPVATLSDEGCAVIEFYDDDRQDFWGSITFLEDGRVDIYASGKSSLEGFLSDPKVLRLLSDGLQITLAP